MSFNSITISQDKFYKGMEQIFKAIVSTAYNLTIINNVKSSGNNTTLISESINSFLNQVLDKLLIPARFNNSEIEVKSVYVIRPYINKEDNIDLVHLSLENLKISVIIKIGDFYYIKPSVYIHFASNNINCITNDCKYLLLKYQPEVSKRSNIFRNLDLKIKNLELRINNFSSVIIDSKFEGVEQDSHRIKIMKPVNKLNQLSSAIKIQWNDKILDIYSLFNISRDSKNKRILRLPYYKRIKNDLLLPTISLTNELNISVINKYLEILEWQDDKDSGIFIECKDKDIDINELADIDFGKIKEINYNKMGHPKSVLRKVYESIEREVITLPNGAFYTVCDPINDDPTIFMSKVLLNSYKQLKCIKNVKLIDNMFLQTVENFFKYGNYITKAETSDTNTFIVKSNNNSIVSNIEFQLHKYFVLF